MQTASRKLNVREAFQEFVAKEKGADLGQSGNDFQRSLFLTEFYVREIHNPTRTSISDEDFELGLADGAKDLGADFIHRDDGQVYIFQSKFHRQGTKVALKDILHFQGVLMRLHNKDWKRNSRVEEAMAEVDWEKDIFHLRFISLGDIEGQARQQTQVELQWPGVIPGFSDRVNIEYYGEAELRDELRNARSQSSGIPGEITLVSTGKRSARSGIIEVETAEHKSFVLIVGASQIVGMHQQARDSLFTLNIRNSIGNTRTNREIKTTAVKSGKLFFLFNNGISCLAKKATLSEDGNSLKTEGLQVINGAQTVKALVKASHDRFPTGEPLLLMRVTEVEKGYGSSGGFTAEVTKSNNTQNVIKVSDFRSNDPIQNDLKRKFDYARFGKKVEYFPKRTDRKVANTTTIRLEEFSKTVYTFLVDPVKFSGSTSFLFDDSETGGYSKVFGDGRVVFDIMPEDEFRLRSAIWWVGVEFDAALKNYKKRNLDSLERAALERKWFLLFAARLVLQKSFGGAEYRKQILPMYKGEWRFGEGREGEWFRELFEIAVGSVRFVYKHASKQPNFLHRNWMRSMQSADDLRDFVLDSPGRTLAPLRTPRQRASD